MRIFDVKRAFRRCPMRRHIRYCGVRIRSASVVAPLHEVRELFTVNFCELLTVLVMHYI